MLEHHCGATVLYKPRVYFARLYLARPSAVSCGVRSSVLCLSPMPLASVLSEAKFSDFADWPVKGVVLQYCAFDDRCRREPFGANLACRAKRESILKPKR
jgi:hypothetical protein